MGRKPKLCDEDFQKLINALKEVNRVQNNLDKTYVQINDLKNQASIARDKNTERKKELADGYKVSNAYINQLLALLSRKARVFRGFENEIGIDSH